jgi:hypothetical protein
LLGPSCTDGAVSRHGYKLNPNGSVVCPASDIAPTASLSDTDPDIADA